MHLAHREQKHIYIVIFGLESCCPDIALWAQKLAVLMPLSGSKNIYTLSSLVSPERVGQDKLKNLLKVLRVEFWAHSLRYFDYSNVKLSVL